ncbi:hypothetical protein ABI_02920 [Asticcacaulis biprosthecium C19]|uniref:Uncharacterized protein n=1 Tax=Asticcacaulis biprosthecium C19 TaxID=715226 RepID=F4QJ29_9CAUL|nr:hypothetical protein [Asticcacaulis biprosthecium]EGF91860.1 hypothetical protein ABI_02920 [Asticcacaulis biprosthecium C19]
MAAFSTLMIGPDGRGRDFRIRAQAQAPEAAVAPDAQAGGVPLILARWAETAEPDLVACLPVPGGDCVVLRARNQGRRESGFACFANAVVVQAGPQQERICLAMLAAIPEPDGSDAFARRPLTVDSLSDPAVPAHNWANHNWANHNWEGLEPRWHRRVVISDGTPPETVLASILTSLAPAENTVMGWANSVHWAPALGPSALIVVAPGRDSQVLGFEPARMTAAGFDGARYLTPLPLRIRDRFLTLMPSGTVIKTDAIEDEATTLASRLLGQMDYDNGLSQILRFAAVPASECDGFFLHLAQRLFGEFVAAHGAQLKRTLDIFEAPEHRALMSPLGPVAPYVLDSSVLCAALDTATLTRMMERHNLAAVLGERRDLARILTDVRSEIAVAIYDRLLSGDVTPVADGLTAAARRLFARRTPYGMPAVLNRHLTAPASFAKTRLLTELVLLIYQPDMPASKRYG